MPLHALQRRPVSVPGAVFVVRELPLVRALAGGTYRGRGGCYFGDGTAGFDLGEEDVLAFVCGKHAEAPDVEGVPLL